MTHKEKAKDLVNRFYYTLPNNGSREGINSTTRRYQEAIKCALITVDNMIEELKLLLFINYNLLNDRLIYWKEVKKEMENIQKGKTIDITSEEYKNLMKVIKKY